MTSTAFVAIKCTPRISTAPPVFMAQTCSDSLCKKKEYDQEANEAPNGCSERRSDARVLFSQAHGRALNGLRVALKFRIYTPGLQVYKWYPLWGLKSINSTYFGLFGAPGIGFIVYGV